MSKRLPAAAALATTITLIQMWALPARAQLQSTIVSRVAAAVPPAVAVAAMQPTWDLTVLQTGSFSATLTWQIEANVSSIQLMVEASDLFRGDDPASTDVEPIPLDTNRPAVITAAHASPVEGGSNQAFWIGPGAPIGAFPTSRTDTITFESSQPHIFSQVVSTQIFFEQKDPIKPMGNYSGRVKITTLIPATAALSQ